MTWIWLAILLTFFALMVYGDMSETVYFCAIGFIGTLLTLIAGVVLCL